MPPGAVAMNLNQNKGRAGGQPKIDRASAVDERKDNSKKLADVLADELRFQLVMNVERTWNTIRNIPNYEQVAGILLFRKIFELAPGAIGLFSFGAEYKGRRDAEALYESEVFISHAKGVVSMLEQVVDMLGPDLEPFLLELTALGARHVHYGVLPAHYGIVGEALLATLETALGPDIWTSEVKSAWMTVYGLVSTAMMTGAEKRLAAKERRYTRIKNSTIAQKNTHLTRYRARIEKSRQSNSTAAWLADVTGIRDLKKSCPDNSRLQCVSKMLDEVISVSSETSASTRSTTAPKTQSLSESINHVSETWRYVTLIPGYEAVAGIMLFKNIFSIAPAARGLFSFASKYEEGDEAMYSNPRFLAHARGVVNMLDVAVNMLGPDLGPVTHALKELGARHVAYGVIPEHYAVVGEALMKTLETALGDKWNPHAQEGWSAIYSFVSTTMIAGASEVPARKETPAVVDEKNELSAFDIIASSWDTIKNIPDYEEVAGVLLFRNIFEIAPAARRLFAFASKYEEGDEALYHDARFLTHARGVVSMLDVAVNMLGPDLGPVTHALKELGARHVAYGVIPEHYPIVGQALLKTLGAALGEDGWTAQVEEGWTSIYQFVSTTMIAGVMEDSEAREEL